MPKRFVALLALVVAAAIALPAIATGPPDKATVPTYQRLAALSGQEENPAADPDGYGAARIQIKGNKICFVILARNIAPATAGHIHKGAPGVNGSIVVDLLGSTAANSTLPPRKSGCVTTSTARATDIRAHPGKYYVNLHNADFPNGAIRGQLSK